MRVRADLSLNLANFNINGFFSTDVHQNDQNVLLFVLKRPIFGYITLHGLIYQESFKKNFWFYVTSACTASETKILQTASEFLGVNGTASLPKIRDFWKCRHAPEDVPTFIIWAWRIRRWPPCKRKRPPCYAILRS